MPSQQQQATASPTPRQQAMRDFKRMVSWIAVAAVLMVIGALAFLAHTDALSIHAVIATVLGVFFSVLLGCGLFALAFFSDKSGHDDAVAHGSGKADED